MSNRSFSLAVLPLGVAVFVLTTLSATSARQQQAAVAIDADDLAGIVTSGKGPEAGVWVIAETTELPTKFVKIVVTDDRGRYLLPDLPGKVTYSVWVRGYGLVDSQKVRTTAGRVLNLTATPAPTPAAAAEYYPAIGGRCCRCRAQASFPAPVPPAMASRQTFGRSRNSCAS
jgi:hypothetical protein